MLHISPNKFIALAGCQQPSVADIPSEIERLQNQIANSASQSFYFRLALKSHKRRLSQLQTQYGAIMRKVHENTLDELLRELGAKKEQIRRIKQLAPSFNRELALTLLQNDMKNIVWSLNWKLQM